MAVQALLELQDLFLQLDSRLHFMGADGQLGPVEEVTRGIRSG